jgi:hypothetical protein
VAIDPVRHRCLTFLLLAALCIVSGCGPPDLSGRTEEEPPLPSPEVQVADPQTSTQLISGWYGVEHHAWRWTARKFAVLLRPPVRSAVTGATLIFDFTLPDVVISRLGSVTLAACFQGTRLAPETFRKAGVARYVREVPASLLSGKLARFDFELDKAMVPGGGDTRELGVVANRVGLEAK